MTYLRRDIEPELLAALGESPIVVLTGARQVGKTTLLTQLSSLRPREYVTLDDFASLEAARGAPDAFVTRDRPLTIDEAQRAPELLVAIKRQVDRQRSPGRFLLSGSATLGLLEKVSESLAGRAVVLRLGPFSQRELTGRAGKKSFIESFLERPATSGGSEIAAPTPDAVVRGGLPPAALGPRNAARRWFRGYEQTYLERDVRGLAQVGDLVAFRTMLKLAALRTAQILNISELARDAKMNVTTARRYVDLVEASFVLARLSPYLTNRSSRLIKSPKIYVTDSGLAAHLCGVHDVSNTADEPLRGALFETWALQNLSAILEARLPDARLYFWHVQGRHEVDFVIELGRDSIAIEVKAAARWTDRDLAGLRAFLEVTPRCRAAILAHAGTTAAQLGEKLFAIPLGTLVS